MHARTFVVAHTHAQPQSRRAGVSKPAVSDDTCVRTDASTIPHGRSDRILFLSRPVWVGIFRNVQNGQPREPTIVHHWPSVVGFSFFRAGCAKRAAFPGRGCVSGRPGNPWLRDRCFSCKANRGDKPDRGRMGGGGGKSLPGDRGSRGGAWDLGYCGRAPSTSFSLICLSMPAKS